MPSGSATQFRYTQTPSKVLHLRNMPWECTEEELVELCKPFGRVVNTMCNVGANRNQAFVEFADQNQAISMVSYYASSSEPAQVRGKTVYIQYSNRQEITNNKGTGDSSGNVLLVTFEGVQPNDISIDVIHLVFSAFGFVHKIATFEKAAGFQALIQYTDAPTALEAKNSLDGRSIPRYLLPEHVPTCHLRITFSAHKDLNIKFQSHRSRDYTNPYLPVNPTAIEGIAQPTLGPDGKIKEPESNVLLASIENMQYAVTVDVLHTTSQRQQLLNKLWKGTAYMMEVTAHDERSRDYTVSSDPSAQMQAAAQAPGPSTPGVAWQNTAPSASFYGSTAAATPVGQVPAWNPNMQAGAFGSASSAYPTQPMMPGSVPHYPGIGSSSGALPVSFQASHQMPQYGVPPAAPHHAPPAGQPMYFPK
uniref:RRM domain-containing protein n=4 Tax=Oryza TaxID=4527 RepID=A0A0D3H0L4_9ORYZ